MAPSSTLPSHNRPARPRNPVYSMCATIMSLLCTLLVIFGLILLIGWLVLRPRAPKYRVENMSIPYFRLSDGVLNSKVSMQIYSRNPNHRIGFYYDDIRLYAYYRDVLIGSSSIDPFYQGHHDVNLLGCDLVTKGLQLNSTTASSLRNDIMRQIVQIKVLVRVRGRAKVTPLVKPHFKARSRCYINVKPPTTVSDAVVLDKECKLKIHY